ncbi:mitogen-activated protein kinase kinase kinase [Fusarium falciforme]|nr:mitogen-activated protein kinase kinase kinase [Fusarium falciforme]
MNSDSLRRVSRPAANFDLPPAPGQAQAQAQAQGPSSSTSSDDDDSDDTSGYSSSVSPGSGKGQTPVLLAAQPSGPRPRRRLLHRPYSRLCPLVDGSVLLLVPSRCRPGRELDPPAAGLILLRAADDLRTRPLPPPRLICLELTSPSVDRQRFLLLAYASVSATNSHVAVPL